MANLLKNLKLTSVDLVRAGANQEADICLFKSLEPPDPVPAGFDEFEEIPREELYRIYFDEIEEITE